MQNKKCKYGFYTCSFIGQVDFCNSCDEGQNYQMKEAMGIFSATTDDMPAIDEISDIEGDEKEMALFNLISDKIEDEVAEWLDRY